MKICPNCGAKNPEQMCFCVNDRYPLDDQINMKESADIVICLDTSINIKEDKIMKICPNCGAKNSEQMRFCINDQYPLDDQINLKESADIVECLDTSSNIKEDKTMKICQHCGAKNPDKIIFCIKCQSLVDGPDAPKASADIVFCFDTTSNMKNDFNFWRKNAMKFMDDLHSCGVRSKIAIIEFHDLKNGEQINIIVPFTESFSDFDDGIFNLQINNSCYGDDEHESSSLDAIWTGLELTGFRGKPTRPYIVLITNAPPHDPDYNGRSLDDLIIRLREGNERIMLVAPKNCSWEKVKSMLGTHAEHIPIVAGERLDFQIILDRIVKGAVVVAGLQR